MSEPMRIDSIGGVMLLDNNTLSSYNFDATHYPADEFDDDLPPPILRRADSASDYISSVNLY